MIRFKMGDAVRIVDRAATPADMKTGLFYDYYRNLTGTIFKLYGNGETAQAAVEVDIETLPEEIAKRHLDTRDQMRANLTGEAKRHSAPGMEHEFRLRYVILVSVQDLNRKLTSTARNNGNGKRLAVQNN